VVLTGTLFVPLAGFFNCRGVDGDDRIEHGVPVVLVQSDPVQEPLGELFVREFARADVRLHHRNALLQDQRGEPLIVFRGKVFQLGRDGRQHLVFVAHLRLDEPESHPCRVVFRVFGQLGGLVVGNPRGDPGLRLLRAAVGCYQDGEDYEGLFHGSYEGLFHEGKVLWGLREGGERASG